MKSGIYQLLCLENNKKYIGSTSNLKLRERQHFNTLKNNKHENLYLQVEYNKFPDKFKFIILEECKVEDLFERETYWINNFPINELYNISLNATNKGLKYKDTSKRQWNDERRNERSKQYKGKNNPFYGKTHKKDIRKKISEKMKKLSLEQCKEILTLINNKTLKKIAKEYNVSPKTIANIRDGKHWSSKKLGGKNYGENK